MKQYIPKKAIKRGFKVWVRSDGHTGYVGQLDIYTEKKDGEVNVGLGGSVVTRLSRDLVGKNHHLLMDNFFTSVSLLCNLLKDGIYATGTALAQRRNFPKDSVSVVYHEEEIEYLSRMETYR